MALQNGLGPSPDVSSAPTMNALNGRVTVPDPIRSPGLTPVAQPTNTFIRAAPPPDQTEAMRLADSLSSLAPALQAFGSVQQVQQKQDMPGKVAAALTGHTADEQKQILASNPDLQNHMAQNLGNQMLGSATAEDTINRLRTQYTTGGFDRDNGNFDQWVNGAIQQDLSANKDPHFAETYRQRVMAGVENLRGAQLQYGAQKTVQNQDQLIYGNVKGLVGQAVDQGWDADKLNAAIHQSFATTDTVAHKPLQEQQKVLITALGRMAGELPNDPQYAQKFAMIQGILKADQTGPDGKSTGSLMDNTELGGQASDVFRQAQHTFQERSMGDNSTSVSNIHTLAMNGDPSFKAAADQLAQQNPTAMPSEMRVRLNETFDHAVKLKQAQQQKADLDNNYQVQKDQVVSLDGLPKLQTGDIHSMVDRTIVGKDGKPELYSAKDQITDTVAQAQKNIDAKYAGQTDPQVLAQKFQDETKLYSQNGIVNPAWKDLLHAAPAAASTITAAGGDPSPTLAQGYDTYMQLRASAPGLLAKHVDQKGQDFFENARVMQQDMGMDQKQAFAIASKAASDPNWNRSDPGISKRDKDQAIQSALGTWIPFTSSLAGTANSSQPAVEVSEAAEALHRGTGLPWPQAIQQAGDRVKQNYTIINGSAVRTADKQVPPNFGDLANSYIDKWSDDHSQQLKQLGYGKSDITMQALGATNNWALMFKGHPAPIQLPGAAFSLGNLYDIQRDQKNAHDDAANKAAEDNARLRQGTLKSLEQNTDNTLPFMNP